MIITRTPFRVSFFGGGTDYPVWFREHEGGVLTTAINRYCYITCRTLPPFFSHTSRIVWSQIELVQDHRQIQHPVVREALAFMKITSGVELHHEGDLPARTGIGSSSSFTVGVLRALYALRGQMVTRVGLARDAIYIERECLGEHVGCQDQVIAAYGGFNRIDFGGQSECEVTPIVAPAGRLADLQRHLMLVFTGVVRNASDIAREQIEATSRRTAELKEMYAMVDRAVEIITGTGSLVDFGHLLDEAWRLKRTLTPVISNLRIDDIYRSARSAGAIGGKLLGAGGGGFMLLFVPPDARDAVRSRLEALLEVPFAFERSGSDIIFYEPDP